MIASVQADLAEVTRQKTQVEISRLIDARIAAPDLLSEAEGNKIRAAYIFDTTKTKTNLTTTLTDAITKQHKPERASWLKAIGYSIPGNNRDYFMGAGGMLNGKAYHFSIFRDSVVKPVNGVNEPVGTIVNNLLAINGALGHHITFEADPKLHVYRVNVRLPVGGPGATMDSMKTKLDEEVTRVTTAVTALRTTKGRTIVETKE